jgi:hypothetical protein
MDPTLDEVLLCRTSGALNCFTFSPREKAGMRGKKT